MRIEIRHEVEKRFDEMEMEFYCNECGSDVDSRLGLMKWDKDNDTSTPEEWDIMEKIK